MAFHCVGAQHNKLGAQVQLKLHCVWKSHDTPLLRLLAPWVKLWKKKRKKSSRLLLQLTVVRMWRWEDREVNTSCFSSSVKCPIVPVVNRRHAGRVLVIIALLGWYMTCSVEATFQCHGCMWTQVFVWEVRDEMWQDNHDTSFKLSPCAIFEIKYLWNTVWEIG